MDKIATGRLLPALLVFVAIAARLLPGARTIDDAYITFRYAQNLLAGEGLVYNPGERVLGTTTPLYAGLMAGIALFAGGAEAPFPEIAVWVNAAADSATCLLLLAMGRKLAVPLAGIAAAATWALLPFSVTFAIGGLETSVFVLLLTVTAYLYVGGRYSGAALCGALSALARPDAGVLLAALAADRIFLAMRRNGRVPVAPREIAAAGLPLLLWLVPATLYYGTPIPHSVAAKIAAYDLPPEAAFTRLVQHYATPFMDNLTFGSAGIIGGVFVYPFLALLGALRLYKSNPRLWPWLVFPWLWLAAYAIANPLIFRWYLTPPLPPYLFTILAGAVFIRRDLAEAGRGRLASPLLGMLVVAAPVLLIIRGWQLHPDHGPERPAPAMAYIGLELKYIEAAAFLAPLLAEEPGGPVVAAADIGALGYYTGAPILDTLGLVSPQATAYYPTRPEYHANAYAVAPELILDQLPEFVVLLEVYGREGLFKDEDFRELYEEIFVVMTDIYDSRDMPVYRLAGGR